MRTVIVAIGLVLASVVPVVAQSLETRQPALRYGVRALAAGAAATVPTVAATASEPVPKPFRVPTTPSESLPAGTAEPSTVRLAQSPLGDNLPGWLGLLPYWDGGTRR
jgi:hypothetical protein